MFDSYWSTWVISSEITRKRIWFGVLSSWFEMIWEIVFESAQLPLLTGTKYFRIPRISSSELYEIPARLEWREWLSEHAFPRAGPSCEKWATLAGRVPKQTLLVLPGVP